jgi:tRNA pseudouridine32 synthase/23S rRNA pseudouridine746 synthase
LLSVPRRDPGKEDCLSSRVQAEFPDAMIVHRLDMGTASSSRGAMPRRSAS